MITIHDATLSDTATVARFNARLAEESEDKILNAESLQAGVSAMLNDSERRGRYFLARRDGDIVGQVAVTYEWSDWRNGWFWWFQSVYVIPEARRLGVFAKLYDHVLNLARSQSDVCGLRLYVLSSNTGAHRTYLSRGMHQSGYEVLELELPADPNGDHQQ